jgi:hypothetical protein
MNPGCQLHPIGRSFDGPAPIVRLVRTFDAPFENGELDPSESTQVIAILGDELRICIAGQAISTRCTESEGEPVFGGHVTTNQSSSCVPVDLLSSLPGSETNLWAVALAVSDSDLSSHVDLGPLAAAEDLECIRWELLEQVLQRDSGYVHMPPRSPQPLHEVEPLTTRRATLRLSKLCGQPGS